MSNIRIAHARISEKGTINGAAGDQTGQEVAVTDIYGSWEWILRPSTRKERAAIVKTAEEICSNNNIGYSQEDRLSLWEQWKKAGSPAKIEKKCNCDCSSFVAVCCLAAGITVSPDIWTGNEKEALTGTGRFVALKFKDNYPYEGDVLLRTGHTAVVVHTPYSSDDAKSCVMASVPAYEYDNTLFGRYDIRVEAAYIRDGGGLSYQAIGILPYGVKLYNYGYFTEDSRGVKWLLCESEYYFGIKYIGFISERCVVYYGKEK